MRVNKAKLVSLSFILWLPGLVVSDEESAVLQCTFEHILLPYIYDCSKYLQCFHGNIVVKSCPSNLHFSFQRQKCVYPQDSTCEPVPTTQAPTTDPDESECLESCKPHRCDSDFETWANPDDYSTYFECFNNCVCLNNCSEGLVYNETEGYCNFPKCVPPSRDPICITIPTNSVIIREPGFLNKPLCRRDENMSCKLADHMSTLCPQDFYVCYADWTCKFTCTGGRIYDAFEKKCVQNSSVNLYPGHELASCRSTHYKF